ncbi:MAG: anthranilate phosphoribosyltransferase [Pseudomonadota bacterium]
MLDLPSANKLLASGTSLSRGQMQSVMGQIMQGEATPAQIGAFLIALTIKGETVEEIVGAAQMMRELAAKVETASDQITDTVGTGGDGAKLFNVSTASALVAAAGGARMAKHGNRAATGNSGSADVLEAAGVNISITPSQVGHCIDKCGVGFMFAPTHHAATRHAIGPRREIGVRSIFNLLGPLTNPAGARYQLVGVFDQHWVRPLAEVFGQLGSAHTVVVCSDDGLDEISIASGTRAAEFYRGEISEFEITPEDFSIERQSLEPLIVDSAEHSLALIKEALGGHRGPAYDMVAVNAGVTLYAADLASTMLEGVNNARDILDAGKANEKLQQLVEMTQSMPVEN